MSLARKKMGQKKSQSLGSDVKCHITLRVSKLPMFKVWLLQDLNLGLPREALTIRVSQTIVVTSKTEKL